MRRGSARAAPWLWRAWVLAVGLLGLNCRDSTGPRSFAGRLAFAPTFESPTAGIVAFDRLRITLFNAASHAPSTATITASGALVVAADFSFTPQVVTIKQGQYVSWKNTGVPHTSTSDNALWNTNLTPGQTSGPVYFGTVGSFTYHCSIHPSMTGTVTVNP